MSSPPNKARTVSLHDGAYARFVEKLVEKRLKSGLSQQAVAEQLGWNQSIISKIESVQRRLDVIELIRRSPGERGTGLPVRRAHSEGPLPG